MECPVARCPMPIPIKQSCDVTEISKMRARSSLWDLEKLKATKLCKGRFEEMCMWILVRFNFIRIFKNFKILTTAIITFIFHYFGKSTNFGQSLRIFGKIMYFWKNHAFLEKCMNMGHIKVKFVK